MTDKIKQNDEQKIELTKNGYEELNKELDELVNEKLPKVVKRVAVAREHGDLSENAEYQQARDDKDIIDARIAEIEAILGNAKVIKKTRSHKKIGIGSTIIITVKGNNGKKMTFTIVGEFESDPSNGKISSVSPIGKALMGKKKGDKVEIDVPAGKVTYKVEEIK